MWDATVLGMNRERLWEGEIAGTLFDGVLSLTRRKDLSSDEDVALDESLVAASCSCQVQTAEARRFAGRLRWGAKTENDLRSVWIPS
jgi:hypothetical protein